MKANDLKPRYSFEERRPHLEDHVFYVPPFYSAHDPLIFPDFEKIFNNPNPVQIEYCSGNGDWVIDQAVANPEMNWVAVEKRFDRIRKIWAKLKNRSLNNLLIVCAEAWTFTHYYVPNEVIEGVYIHFPDPWPKGRHAKKRLMQSQFLQELARILKKERTVVFVTDDFVYLKETISRFCLSPDFRPLFPEPYFLIKKDDYGGSWFENLWREKGRSIHTSQFVKHGHSN